jgi:hypothetical protein
MRTSTSFLAQANNVHDRLTASEVGDLANVSPLVAWAAHHLGGGLASLSIIEGMRTADGWHQLAESLGIGDFDTLEALAVTISATSTISALDLCSAAAFRLGGGTSPRADEEADLGTWKKERNLKGIHLGDALREWIRRTLAAGTYGVLETARNQVVHRATPRSVRVIVGEHRQPTSTYRIGEEELPADEAVETFTSFGHDRFDAYVAAIAADYG